MRSRYLLVVLFFITFSLLNAQGELRVQTFNIDGELTFDDPISEEMGRISAAVKLNFNQGDYFNSVLSADFVPLLVLVAPSGEYKICYPDEETIEAKFDGRINETGEWLLYIVGDTTDTGTYRLNNKYASASSMDFDTEGDYCKNINLLLEHIEADFYFIKGNNIDGEAVEFESKISFPNVEYSRIFGFGDEWFKAVVFSSEKKSFAETQFNTTEASISDCLKDDWKKVDKGWTNVLGGENISQKTCLFSAKDGSGRYLKLSLIENFNEDKKEEILPYTLEIIINKER